MAPSRGRTKATVAVQNLTGHDFPTGFAFARQFFLEVSARTASGQEVCLAPDPHGIDSPCASGKLDDADQELATCDPSIVGKGNADIEFAVVAPEESCDPWLANFQKILTDGDPDGDGTFTEVEYQSKLPDIVKLRVRTADQKTMAALKPGELTSFDYLFDTSRSGGEPLEVRAVMRFRHLPPSLVKALDGSYSNGLSSQGLLENMTIVDVASNQELGEERTTPKAGEVGVKRLTDARFVIDESSNSLESSTQQETSPIVNEFEAAIDIDLDPSNFGEVQVGSSSPSGTLRITSSGSDFLDISSVSSSRPGEFPLSNDGCSGASLWVGESCTVRVRFTPQAAGSRSATLSIDSDAASGPSAVNVGGTGVTAALQVPALSLAPDPLNFNQVQLSTRSPVSQVRGTNTGNAPLTIQTATLSGANPGDFSLVSDGCSGQTLQPDETCVISAAFSPRATGERTARLTVSANLSGSPPSVTLNGVGVTTPATTTSTRPARSTTTTQPVAPVDEKPALEAVPNPLDFGRLPVGDVAAPRALTVTSKGDAELRIDSVRLVEEGFNVAAATPGEGAGTGFSISSEGCSGRPLSFNQFCIVEVVFQPSSLGPRSARIFISSNAPDAEVQVLGEGADPDRGLVVAPASTLPGSLITAEGTGCAPGSPVHFFVDGLPVRGELLAAPDGSFRATIDLPDNLAAGRRRVQAECDIDLTGTVDLVFTTQSALPAGPLAGTLLVMILFLLRALTLARKRSRK